MSVGAVSVDPSLWLVALCFRRPLPHSIRSDLAEVCLFVKDEPNSTPENTESVYRKLLKKRGVKTVSQVRRNLIFSSHL